MKKIIKHILPVFIVLLVIMAISWKLKANKANNKAEAELANVKAAAIPVKVDTVKVSNYIQNIEMSGAIKNKTDLLLFAETQGRIIKIYKEKGSWVNKGEAILEIDDSVLKEQCELAKTNYEYSKLDYERMKKLVEKNAVTQKNLEDITLKYTQSKAELARITKMLNDTKVTSPVSGFINDSYYEEGMLISGSVKLCNIISINNLIITTEVNSKDVLSIESGDNVTLKVDEYPNNYFSGNVTNIAEKALSNSRFAIEISIDENNYLKAGMFAKATIEKVQTKAIIVDRNAISGSLQDASMFIVENNKLVEQKVKIKKTLGNSVEIIDGLSLNQIYVVSGTINLYESAKVKIVD
ncbi:MAG: efflux RND transporter periplasmic adaptor subunit [Bacteroidales bacterium]|nr:efflux RND transporter periplasmic adaptor subunit [Bacteroidales bacterium]